MAAQPNGSPVIPAKERLIVALDVADAASARSLVEELGEAVHFYKLGLELAMSGSYFELLSWLKDRNKQIFADLKFYDIPATVGSAVRQLAAWDATFITVHGDRAIMEAAAENKGPRLKTLAVTVLTSLDRSALREMGFADDIETLVLARARSAREAGCDGVIASGLEVSTLRASLGPELLVVTPGIRRAGDESRDDQKRIVTPRRALEAGADYIVVGRPIRHAPNPRAAAEAIQAEIAEVVR